MIEQLSKEQTSQISENNGLSRYLDSLIVGRDATPRSWLYEHRDPDEVLQGWISTLESLSKGQSTHRLIYDFDIAQASKWGPMGKVEPLQNLKGLLNAGFTDDIPKSPDAFSTTKWAVAKRRATDYLMNHGVKNLRPRSFETVVDDMNLRDTLESNAGWPDFQRRSIADVRQRAIADAHDGTWREYPAISLFRNYYGKTRLVWMFPMSVNIVEGSFTQPLMNALVKGTTLSSPFFMPWKGFNAVKEVITAAYAKSAYIAASDFTATDAHFTINATREMYDVLAPTFQASARKGLLESLERLHTIPLVFSKTEMVTGYHGVASGSNWTNLIETVFDLTFSFFVEDHVIASGLYAIGDDMSWITPSYLPELQNILERLGIAVGQVIRAEKTNNFVDRVVTLQRLFIRGYKSAASGLLRGVYPTVRALNASVNPEKFHNPKLWTSDMFCARQYMILENCVDHPLFQDFVKYVVVGQKDLIPFAKLKRSRLDAVLRETKLLPGLNPSYNQEKRGYSFADFESIRIASRL